MPKSAAQQPVTQHAWELELKAALVEFAHDPEGFADTCIRWGEGELKGKKLRMWQRSILRELGEALRKAPQNADTLIASAIVRIAVASGHGIGKSALIAIIILWAMATCVDCRGTVTANTKNQLTQKTWAELAKWHRNSVVAHMFTCNAMSLVSTDPKREQTWRIDATPWSANNTEAVAGLHNQGKRLLLIFDEASAIDDKVWEVADGAQTDADTEIIWIVFGNPTRSTGRFRECFRRFRAFWTIRRNIDNRTVEGTNREFLDGFVALYGEDSDIVKVRVRGEFPSQSVLQFIGELDVREAAKRNLREHQFKHAPLVIGVDPAWTGADEFVIYMRQGLRSKILKRIPYNDDDVAMAQLIADFEDELEADAVFIDYGHGTGIYSIGKNWGRKWQLFNFGVNLPKSHPSGCLNNRARIWKDMKEWLKDGGVIENIEELIQDLTGVEVVPRVDGCLQLESKEDMKARGLPSPNLADALALTFAHPVKPRVGSERDSDTGHFIKGKTDRPEC